MDKIKKNKLLYFLGVLIIGVFIVLIVRVTYAFLGANINEARENIVVDSDTTDNLQFSIGDPLVINATPTTLPENGANLVDESVATATLLANSTNDTAEYSYYVYFTISNNTFIYSDGSTPEIILTVTGPDDNPVTNIEGLTYGTFNGVSGFDITIENGTFTVASDYAITSNSSTNATEQTWNFTLTYLNQSYDQSTNFGNSLTTEVSMTKKEVDNSLATYIVNLYTADGENGLYYHDADLTNGAGDNSYRYSGVNPNNYVCFGNDEATCPTDNLYRIIGVFDGQVKLIKYDYANSDLLGTNGDYAGNIYSSYDDYKGYKDTVNGFWWNMSTLMGIWSESNLNMINLNTNYINSFGEKWQNLIALTDWMVGDSMADTYTAKIGLMYVSDYVYSFNNSDYWASSFTNYGEIKDNNWMYMGLKEWTIDKGADEYSAMIINNNGNINYYGVDVESLAVRPVFYLSPTVIISGGSGLVNDPYRIS